MEKLSRSLVKTLSWRFVVLILDFIIAYLFTRDFGISSKLALAKMAVASVFYLLHERAWNKVIWGKISQAIEVINWCASGLFESGLNSKTKVPPQLGHL